MRTFQIILLIVLCVGQSSLQAQTSSNYAPNTVIFKVNHEYRSLCEENKIESPALNEIIQRLESYELTRIFPHHRPPRSTYNSEGIPLTDLSLIYELTYTAEVANSKIIRAISYLELTQYAQPRSVPKPLYTPIDDTVYQALQYHLDNIQAYAAWDSVKGDTNIVIGITDSGVDTAHIDLVDNIKYNYNDPIDGIDNDNDGYVDNYRGWDMGDNDNDPSSTGIWFHHGTAVAGLAAASTDNGIHGAGVGFKCKFLPIKLSRDIDGDFIAAYEGIVYAADHGCQIINCSWGSTDPTGQFEQDVIDYATINMNSLVVAAAGNSNNETVFYPASLNYVTSVGGTDASDNKYIVSSTSGSNYGRNLDLCAPGANIYSSTVPSNFSLVNSGTSYATPILAGCAAIVKARFPNYTAIQIGERLKVTTDTIDTLSGNASYQEKLGSGRVNLYRAITDSATPSIVMIKYSITDGNDEWFTAGDTLRFQGTFKNYLAASSPSTFVTLSSTNPNISLLQTVAGLGSINTLDTAGNYGSPLLFKINPSAGTDEVIELRLEFSDLPYRAYKYIEVLVNPSTVDIDVNTISTTLTSDARFGFEDNTPIESRAGLGFQYKGEQLLFEGGLMVGAQIGSTTFVSDNIWDSLAPDVDFISTVMANEVTSSIADIEAHCVVNDDGAGANMMDLSVDHSVYAWANVPNENYVMIKYRIINNGSDTLLNLYAGITADWDIRSFNMNVISNDFGTRMGFTRSTESGSPYVGIKLLTEGEFRHYAIDNYAGAPGLDIYYPKTFSTAKKYIALSTNRLQAGTVGSGNDVIDVVSSGPFTVLPQDTVVVSFALVAGDDLLELTTAANAAQVLYDSLFPLPVDTTSSMGSLFQAPHIELFPNPSDGKITIVIDKNIGPSAILEIVDIAGHLVYRASMHNNKDYWEHDLSELKGGIYQYRVRSNQWEYNGKVVLVQ